MPKDYDSDTGEIPLVDDFVETNDSEIPLVPIKSSSSSTESSKPLRRLWKSETDEEIAEEVGKATEKKSKTAKAEEAPARAAYSVPVARPKKSKAEKSKSTSKAGATNQDGTKKALVEETPSLDTYEARKRARWIIGGLFSLIMTTSVWVGYRAFFRSTDSDDASGVVASAGVTMAPEPKAGLDQEANFMLARANEFAKQERTEQAIAMFKNVVKVYPKTNAAREAQEALDRPKRGLPLYLGGPAVVAVPRPSPPPPPPADTSSPPVTKPAGPAPQPAPAPVVNAVPATPNPGQGSVGSMPSQTLQNQPRTEVTVTPPPGNPAMVAKVDPARATPDIPDVPDRPLPNGFRKITEAGKHESGWPLMIAGDRDQVPMVLVPGATFTMGSDRGEAAEAPSHSVRLSTYYIDQHEVTCGQFRNYLEKEPRGKTDAAKWLADEKFRSAPDQAPVVGITYREADTYALWAGKRLPTEAQWEMAARSFESRRYPWGNDPPKWSRPRAPRQISEVKSFPEDESIYGAFDMAGNALEWTRDWYDPRYFEKLVDKVAEDPAGPIKAYRSIVRVVKGGSKSWLLSAREGTEIDRRLPYLGFRCMVAVEGPDAPASIVVRPTTKPAAAQPSQAGQPAANSVPF